MAFCQACSVLQAASHTLETLAPPALHWAHVVLESKPSSAI
jgi:hypothetical protein